MSIQKIARMAGVSVATVSRVLNNSDSVKPANRQKVLEAIEESNYQPNLLARQLRTARSSMILVLVSDISNPFCAEVVKGIEEQAEKNGYRILLCNSGADIARSRSSLQLLSGKMVDGIITMDAFSKLPELSQLIGKAPWVQCAEHDDNGQISCVGIDDDVAAQSVVNYLAGQGRQRIALINYDLRYRYARLRQQGYAHQLKEQQLAWQAIIRLMDVANESQTLAAAMNHSALNIANAMGAYLGGLTVSLGYGWISTAWVGVALGVAGLMVFVLTARHAARQQTQLA